MSRNQQNTPVETTHAGLKSALFYLFAADDINHGPWSRYGLMVVAPFFILGYLVNFGIEVSKTYYAKNQNYLRALNLGSSLSYAAIAATIGISILVSTNPYAAFFWYFLSMSGVSAALLQSGVKLFYHAYQALVAPAGSIERAAFLQSTIKDLYQLALGVSIYITLLYMPGPGSEITSNIFVYCCGITASMSMLGVCWEMLRDETKHLYKTYIGIEKPERDMKQAVSHHCQSTSQPSQQKVIIPSSEPSVFQRTYRKAAVAEYRHRPNAVLTFLKSEINKKLEDWKSPSSSSKIETKAQALTQALQVLDSYQHNPQKSLVKLDELLNESSYVHQSFFAHTSDTVDILQAVKSFLMDHIENQPSYTQAYSIQ